MSVEEKARQAGKQHEQRTKAGMRKVPKTYIITGLAFSFYSEETEAQRIGIIFLMATLLGQKSELGFELLPL